MKSQFILFVSAAVIALTACTEKIPTACECHQALKKDGREASIYPKCQEMRTANADFDTEVRQCAANDILKGNTKVEKAESSELVVPDAGIYAVDPMNSALTWTGKKITGKNHFGSIMFNSGNLEFENGSIKSGDLSIDMTTITVLDIKDEKMKAKLEGHLNSPDFFDTAKFPESKFVLSSVEKGENSSFKVKGNLTIKGITQEVSGNILLVLKNNQLIGGGTVTFDRSKFDVKYGSGSFFENLGDDLIEDNVDMKIKIVAKAANLPA